MIRASMRYVQCVNGVIARSANSAPQFKKPMTCSLAPSVGGTLLQSKMYGSYSGSFSQPALPTDMVINFTNDVKKDVEKAAKRPFPEYIPVLFSQQINSFPGVPSETEYHVKVQTGEIDYIQVRMAATMPEGGVWFNGFLDHRTKQDPIRPYVPMPLGFSDVQLATPYVINLAEELKGELENAIDIKFSEFKAVLYRFQGVAGWNYMVKSVVLNLKLIGIRPPMNNKKVQTSSDVYLHMKMFQGLPQPIEPPVKLISYEYPKTKEDPLV